MKTFYGVIEINLNDDRSGRLTLYAGNSEQVWEFGDDQHLTPKELKELWQNLLDRIS